MALSLKQLIRQRRFGRACHVVEKSPDAMDIAEIRYKRRESAKALPKVNFRGLLHKHLTLMRLWIRQ